MKKGAIGLIILALLVGTFRYVLGFYPWRLGDAIDVASGLGAKLACSGYFVTGQTKAQIIEDLASYSPATRLLELTYSEKNKSVVANMLDLAEQSATYREDIGCALDIGDTTSLSQLRLQRPAASLAAWPQGNVVNSVQAPLQSRLDTMLAADNQAGYQTRALLVVKNGLVAAESYAPGYDAHSKLLGWSMGKSVTAMLIGAMQQQGIMDVSETTGLDEWQQDARKEIRVEHLLQMRSGLVFDETYAPGSDSTRMLFSAHSASDVALQALLGHPIGEHFSYSSGTTNILARLIQERLGGSQAMLDFFQQAFLSPMQLSDTLFEVDPSGVFVGSSYIYASARDWGKLGLLMLNKGDWFGQRILPSDWVEQAAVPINSENYRKYGYQFWLNSNGKESRWAKLPDDAYMMMGNRKQVVMIIPSKELVIVRLGWTSGAYPTEENFAQLIAFEDISPEVISPE